MHSYYQRDVAIVRVAAAELDDADKVQAAMSDDIATDDASTERRAPQRELTVAQQSVINNAASAMCLIDGKNRRALKIVVLEICLVPCFIRRIKRSVISVSRMARNRLS